MLHVAPRVALFAYEDDAMDGGCCRGGLVPLLALQTDAGDCFRGVGERGDPNTSEMQIRRRPHDFQVAIQGAWVKFQDILLGILALNRWRNILMALIETQNCCKYINKTVHYYINCKTS